MDKKMTKREMRRIEKQILNLRKQVDVAKIEKRSKAVLNALVSNDVINTVLLNEKYSDFVIETAFTAFLNEQNDGYSVAEFLKEIIDDEYQKEAEKVAKKTKNNESEKSVTPIKKSHDISNSNMNLDKTHKDFFGQGSKGSATPPQAQTQP